MAKNQTRPLVDLFSISDPKMRNAFKTIQDQLAVLQGATNAPAWKGAVDASGNALQNLQDGVDDTDAVTVQQLKAATNLKHIVTQLQAGGSNPINVTNLVGASTPILNGTHATRLATPPQANTFFFETDRTALYWCGDGSAWIFAAGGFLSSIADQPADLGTNDVSFVFTQHDAGGDVIWNWSGSAWYGVGTEYGLLSALPAASMRRQGMYYYATDYNRLYLCKTGAAWQDAPGQPPRGQICLFDPKDSLTGWHACDGSTVTASTETGGTQSVTLPNFFSGVNFLAAAASSGTGTFGAVGTTYTYAQYQAFFRL